jgi:hypothetical protein
MDKVEYKTSNFGLCKYADEWLNEQKNDFEIVGYVMNDEGRLWITIKIYVNRIRA